MVSFEENKLELKMTDTFFTSDTHFSHQTIIRYCNRPFKDVNEMNEVMIANWNSIVKPTSTVYHLGDVGFGNLRNILIRLNGKIILIKGSHDKSVYHCKDRFELITPLLEIDVEGEHITLCHYAMKVWPRSHYNAWHLFGHSHGKLEGQGKSFDTGVDGHGFRPWSFEEVREEMRKRSDNFNLVRRRNEEGH